MSNYAITIEGYTFDVELNDSPDANGQVQMRVDGQPVQVAVPDPHAAPSKMEWFLVEDRPYEVMLDPDMKWVRANWGLFALEVQDQHTPLARRANGDGRIKAPIPGQISQVKVAVGEAVQAGQSLLVLEAMKMENEIRAPHAGRVTMVNVIAGQRVSLNDMLVEIE